MEQNIEERGRQARFILIENEDAIVFMLWIN